MLAAPLKQLGIDLQRAHSLPTYLLDTVNRLTER